MNRIFALVKSALVTVFSNKKRLLLTVGGISLSAFLFTFVQLIMQVPLQVDFVKYMDFPKDALLILGDFQIQEDHLITGGEDIYKYSRVGKSLIFTVDGESGSGITLLEIFGVEENFLDFPVISTDYPDSLEVSQLVFGRSFTPEDSALKRQVLIIDVATSLYLYGTENAVGKYLTLSTEGFEGDFLVIGIVSNTQSAYVGQKVIEKNMDQGNPDPVNFQAYYPLETSAVFNNGSVNAYIVRSSYDPETLSELMETKLGDSLSHLYSYETHYQSYLENSAIQGQFTLLIQTIIIVLSAFSLAVSQLFSLKSRLFEIGIKKAVGAQNIDILFQFQIESLLTGFFGSLFGVISGAFCSSMISLFISLQVGTMLLFVSFTTLFLDMVIVIVMSMTSTLIPSWLASRQNILLSLRID